MPVKLGVGTTAGIADPFTSPRLEPGALGAGCLVTCVRVECTCGSGEVLAAEVVPVQNLCPGSLRRPWGRRPAAQG